MAGVAANHCLFPGLASVHPRFQFHDGDGRLDVLTQGRRGLVVAVEAKVTKQINKECSNSQIVQIPT